MTRSLHIALADLKLDSARIVYPGDRRYRVHPKVEVVPLAEALGELGPQAPERFTPRPRLPAALAPAQ